MRITSGDYYDFSILNGDIETIEGFDTAIQMSFFCERRASESEIKIPQKRRGWCGNEASEIVGFEIGSKLWLLSQARLDQVTLNKAIDFIQDANNWFVEDKYATKVAVSGEMLDSMTIILYVKYYKNNSIVAAVGYDVWRRSFVDGEI